MVPTDGETLGKLLTRVRTLKDLSLSKVAKPAGITAAYLQKLERDEVKNPGPNVLFGLSKSLSVSYTNLMKLAGYVVPDKKEKGSATLNLLAQAFHSENLTEDEVRELAEFLAFKRRMRK